MNVKVHNLNKYDYKEVFKGSEVLIPAGGFVEMDYFEAKLFLSKLGVAPAKLANGLFDPRTFKMLKIDPEDEMRSKDMAFASEASEVEKVFVCQGCAKEFRTKNGLLKHIKDKHQSQMEKEARDELLDNEDLD